MNFYFALVLSNIIILLKKIYNNDKLGSKMNWLVGEYSGKRSFQVKIRPAQQYSTKASPWMGFLARNPEKKKSGKSCIREPGSKETNL